MLSGDPVAPIPDAALLLELDADGYAYLTCGYLPYGSRIHSPRRDVGTVKRLYGFLVKPR